jgi:hypothetical protein
MARHETYQDAPQTSSLPSALIRRANSVPSFDPDRYSTRLEDLNDLGYDGLDGGSFKRGEQFAGVNEIDGKRPQGEGTGGSSDRWTEKELSQIRIEKVG